MRSRLVRVLNVKMWGYCWFINDSRKLPRLGPRYGTLSPAVRLPLAQEGPLLITFYNSRSASETLFLARRFFIRAPKY